MASLKEIAREYRDEIMDGIAWVAIWKTGRYNVIERHDVQCVLVCVK